MNVIEVKNLTKDWGKQRGAYDLNFTIKQGEIVGFLGPNGAGKSTTIEVLLGLINKTRGDAMIFGQEVGVNASNTHRDLGFLSTDMSLDNNLTSWQALEFFGHLHGKFDRVAVKSLARCLQADLSVKIKKLSRGNRQKISLIAALMNRPKLLIMDEPTSGFDPVVEAEFVKLIKAFKKRGGTAFISSHILSEVENICDRIIFIDQGKIIEDTTMAQLRKKAPKKTIVDLDAVFMEYYRSEMTEEDHA
jgi:ABC-2 type transport system ATP-binding protein